MLVTKMVRMKRYGRRFVRRDATIHESNENTFWRDYMASLSGEGSDENIVMEKMVMHEKAKGNEEISVLHESEDTMFSDGQLKLMEGFEEGEDHIKVLCGCTNKRYGDFDGELRVTSSGQFLVNCKCFSDCDQANLTPDEFEKHSMREGTRKWQEHIWVILGDHKVPVGKTALLKYYKHATNNVNNTAIARRKRNIHRDEFIKCTACGMDKRFTLRTQDQFRCYHRALSVRSHWKCQDHPDGLGCCSKKERECRKAYQVCPRTRTCKGCEKCVCMGCFTCRLRDCHCRDCVDFFTNAPAYI